MFGELLPPLLTPVFIDNAAGLALTAPALEGGHILHLSLLPTNVLRAKAQRTGLGRAGSDDPPLREVGSILEERITLRKHSLTPK
jgi:hypothetical protein